MACKEEGFLLCTASQGFSFRTRQGIKTFYIHPALCRGMKHNPHQLTHCLLSPQATVTLPSFICWKRRHSNFVVSQHQSLRQSDGGCLVPSGSPQLALLNWLSSPSGTPTPAWLCPCPQPSRDTVVAQRKLTCQPTPDLFPAGLQEEDA